MGRTTYFLPEALSGTLDCLAPGQLKVSEETLEIDGFNFKGHALKGNARARASYLKDAKVKHGLNGIYSFNGGQTLFEKERVTSLNGVRVRLGAARSEVMVPEVIFRRDLEKLEPILADFKETLSWLAERAGMDVLIDVRDGGFAPFRPRGRNMLHVVLGAVAPGEPVTCMETHLCGLPLTVHGSEVSYVAAAAQGTGVSVRDEEGKPVAQVAGNTLYITIPIGIKFDWALKAKGGLGLFKKVLQLAWNTYVENPEVPLPIPLDDAPAFADFVERRVNFFPSIARNMLEQAEEDARRTHELYLSKLQHVKIMRSALQHSEVRTASHEKEASIAEFERIRSNPHLRTFGVLKDAFHATTQPIVCEYGGKRYRLGTYTIRVSLDGRVMVWAEQPLHPGGFPHPHIGWSGAPCFGNLSIAIDQAAVEFRYAVTLELVLRWLSEGYEPLLAEIPITEWPEEIQP